jgi:hypothetical protein
MDFLLNNFFESGVRGTKWLFRLNKWATHVSSSNAQLSDAT